MRSFSQFEQQILKRIVKARTTESFENFAELHLANLIDTEMGVVAIEWNLDDNYCKVVYKEKIGLYKLYELLGLIQYLIDSRLIFVYYISSEIQRKGELYNRKKYKKDEIKGQYYSEKDESLEFEGKEFKVMYYHMTNSTVIKNSIGHFVAEFSNKMIFPNYSLIDLVNNDFVTIEQKRHNDEMRIMRKTYSIALIGMIISTILGVIGWFMC